MIRKSLLAFAMLCGCATAAHATTTISAGDHNLLPHTPGQVVSILISDDGIGQNPFGSPPGEINDVDLFLLVADGTQGPVITGFDLIGPGTIFAANNFGQFDLGDPFTTPGRQPFAWTGTPSGYVSANGVLARITIDTTGIPMGDYALSLNNPILGQTDTGDLLIPPLLLDGVLHVTPEPASIVMALMGAAALGAVVIRKRRA